MLFYVEFSCVLDGLALLALPLKEFCGLLGQSQMCQTVYADKIIF